MSVINSDPVSNSYVLLKQVGEISSYMANLRSNCLPRNFCGIMLYKVSSIMSQVIPLQLLEQFFLQPHLRVRYRKAYMTKLSEYSYTFLISKSFLNHFWCFVIVVYVNVYTWNKYIYGINFVINQIQCNYSSGNRGIHFRFTMSLFSISNY